MKRIAVNMLSHSAELFFITVSKLVT